MFVIILKRNKPDTAAGIQLEWASWRPGICVKPKREALSKKLETPDRTWGLSAFLECSSHMEPLKVCHILEKLVFFGYSSRSPEQAWMWKSVCSQGKSRSPLDPLLPVIPLMQKLTQNCNHDLHDPRGQLSLSWSRSKAITEARYEGKIKLGR